MTTTAGTFSRVFGWCEHAAAVIAGLILMIVGLALGVTMIMLPVGLVVGLVGVALFVGGMVVHIDGRT